MCVPRRGRCRLIGVEKAVASETEINTVGITDDTDILVLLIYHAGLTKCNIGSSLICFLKKVKRPNGVGILQQQGVNSGAP